jgi:RNA polymerase sigma-70 factor, ECF subfamily
MAPTEQDLLQQAQAFDHDALAVIYDRYSPGLHRYALRLLGDDCQAEDCVSETFSRFLKALRSGQGPRDHLQAYLYRIAHNLITDIYRRQPPPPLDLDERMVDGDSLRPERASDLRLAQDQIRLALRSLTPEQRQVITLRFIEGWENEEIAAALQKPVGAVKSLQHRAMNTLRKLWIGQEEDSYVFSGWN